MSKKILGTDEKPVVVFVGSFMRGASDGTVGGQMFACTSLVDSPISTVVDWLLIDSTMKSLPQPHILLRVWYAFRRIIRLLTCLMFYRTESVLIFTAWDFLSFLEKGLMGLIGAALGKRVIISVRSEVRLSAIDRYFLRFRRRALSACATVICQSREAEQRIQDICQPEMVKTIVIPNWIDRSQYRKAEQREEAVSSCHRFIFLGWLEVYKGIYVLLEAASLLKQRGHSFHLTVCGGGRELSALQAKCREQGLDGQVSLRGWVTGEPKIEALAAADTLVLPSFSEGMPNAVLEAMASGLAIIATPVGGIPSLVEAEKNGLLVSPGDCRALADAMEDLILHPEKTRRMGMYNATEGIRAHDVNNVWPLVGKQLGVPEGKLIRLYQARAEVYGQTGEMDRSKVLSAIQQ